MINKKKLTALLLTGTILMGMNTTVLAETVPTVGTGTEAKDATVSITKNLEFAEGLVIPNTRFTFIATPKTEGAPVATITDISYGTGDTIGNLDNGKYTLSKTSEIVFGKFPHAGQYEYTVTEKKGDMAGMTYSAKTYTIHVYVANKRDNSGETYIKTITAEESGTKTSKIVFTNTYTKKAALTIEKNTMGELADKTKDFAFAITFIKSETSDQTEFVGRIGTETITCEVGKEKQFMLHDKEKLVFDNLPVGTKYVVKEKGVSDDGYTPSIHVVENNKVTVNNQVGNERDDLSSANVGVNNLVGEGKNEVIFTNTYKDIAITGIIFKQFPFILLMGIALLAFGSLAIIKRSRTTRK
ncbi:DUF7601 domain-containing protein [Faecalimonas sp.]